MSDLDNYPQPEDSLASAKEWLLDRVRDGARCPCCTQMAKVYRRKLHTAMVLSLITIYKRGPHYQNVNLDVRLKAGDTAKLRYWGLLERDPERLGHYRVTALGRDFVLNRVEVASHVEIYDDRLLRVDDTKTISVVEALGEKFDYLELLAAAPTTTPEVI